MRFFTLLGMMAVPFIASHAVQAAQPYDYGSADRALSFSWTGPFLGVDAGYGSGKTDWDFSNGSTTSNTQDGGIVGFHAGYNQQLSSALVVGFEGSVNGTDMYGHSGCLNVYSCRTDVNMLADLSARLGIAFDRAMVFGKAGIAYEDTTHAVEQPYRYIKYSDRGGDVGYLVGIGAEYALAYNITASLEYNFMGFSDDTSDYGYGLTSKDKEYENVIKAGMSLKLY